MPDMDPTQPIHSRRTTSRSAAFAPAERALLETLDRALRATDTVAILGTVADQVAAELARRREARLAWAPIPLDIYDALPKAIASSWVFVLRAGCTSGAERHPNSIQRVMSFRGAGDLQTWNGERWLSHLLSSDPRAPLEQRWLSIPASVWHRPVMGGKDWVVVSFHTSADDNLIEERATDDENPDARLLASELYAGRKAR